MTQIAQSLDQLGLKPVLVGGMALVILGSQRVARDFDFVISKPDNHLEKLLSVFYEKGLELVSTISDNGEVVSTIDHLIRLKNSPNQLFFSR